MQLEEKDSAVAKKCGWQKGTVDKKAWFAKVCSWPKSMVGKKVL